MPAEDGEGGLHEPGSIYWFARKGKAPIQFAFRLPPNIGTETNVLHDTTEVELLTLEGKVGGDNCLGKFGNRNDIYYRKGGRKEQRWKAIKVRPSSGAIHMGEEVFLLHVASGQYLCATDAGYLRVRKTPYTEEGDVSPGYSCRSPPPSLDEA